MHTAWRWAFGNSTILDDNYNAQLSPPRLCSMCCYQVPQDDGRFWCEGDGKAIDTAQHRYLLKAKVTDCTGECWVNIFNQQVQQRSVSMLCAGAAMVTCICQATCLLLAQCTDTCNARWHLH